MEASIAICSDDQRSRQHEVSYHLAQTFSWVREQLKSDNALSDSTITVILCLVLQEQLRKSQVVATIHYQGLRKMIELRGGLEQLEGNLPLLLKICK